MLYYKCPTCKTILANKQILYETELDAICKNDNLSMAEKNNQKKKILDNLQIKNQCCRARTISYIRQIELIK